MRRTMLRLAVAAGLFMTALAQAREEGARGKIIYSRWSGEAIGIHLADGRLEGDRALAAVRGQDQVHPALSPDGKRVAFAAPGSGDPNDFNLYMMNVDGSEVKQIVPDAALPAWSPDGKQLLYATATVPPGVGI